MFFLLMDNQLIIIILCKEIKVNINFIIYGTWMISVLLRIDKKILV